MGIVQAHICRTNARVPKPRLFLKILVDKLFRNRYS